MAKKKAEMEEDQANYAAWMAKARSAEREGMYHEAVRLALASWDYIDGMMQYERKYADREFANVQGIEIVLRYAPLLLDYKSLDELESLLKKYPRIDRVATDDIAQQLADARGQMWDAHRLWDHLERHPGFRQDKLRHDLGGDQEQWRTVVEFWERMGLVVRTPEGGSYRVALGTRMGGVVTARCPACGKTASAPKAMFFEELDCPECGVRVVLVILTPETAAQAKE